MGDVTDRMTPQDGDPGRRSAVLVWIDSREAIVVPPVDSGAPIERIVSDVPAHHRSTGHMRHDPAVRHGGGRDQSSAERRRLDHLDAFLKDVIERLPGDIDLLIVGPGEIRRQLATRIRARDVRVHASRTIETSSAQRMTDRQLAAELRRHLDQPTRRRTVGRYLWTVAPVVEPSGHPVFRPYRRGGEHTEHEESGG